VCESWPRSRKPRRGHDRPEKAVTHHGDEVNLATPGISSAKLGNLAHMQLSRAIWKWTDGAPEETAAALDYVRTANVAKRDAL
jgi:hypothetical protein